ncbi:MAG: thermonuclease family protein [Akkermansiaceae bacterium]
MMVILTLVVGLVAWYIKDKHPQLLDDLTSGQSSSSVSIGELTEVKVVGDEYEILENCTLAEHKHNDGDSFHIKHHKGQDEIRLYYADTAESAYKTYGGGENNGDRLDKQGQYFGGLNRDQTAKLGQLGKKRTMSLIKGKKFKVITKWEPVTDKPSETRIHAYIVLEEDGKEYYLHELLVNEGLVRLSTWGSNLPDGTSWKKQKERLKAMENNAKERKVGAWGMKN